MGDAAGRRRAARRVGPVRILAALIVAACLGGCRADLTVEIDAAAGGGGHVRAVVRLDEEAAAQVPDLARQLRVDDLERAGWDVEGPERGDGVDAAVTLRVSKPFSSPAGAAKAIRELSGPGGPFSDLHITRTHSVWKTRTALAGTVDLRAGLGAFGDAGLAEKLGGPNLGIDPAAVERELGKPLSEAVHVAVVGRLPGTVESNAPSTSDDGAVWPVALGATASIAASSEAWNVVRLAFAGLAVVSGLTLLGLLVRRSRLFSWM